MIYLLKVRGEGSLMKKFISKIQGFIEEIKSLFLPKWTPVPIPIKNKPKR